MICPFCAELGDPILCERHESEIVTAARAQDAERIRELEGEVRATQGDVEAVRKALTSKLGSLDAWKRKAGELLSRLSAMEREQEALKAVVPNKLREIARDFEGWAERDYDRDPMLKYCVDLLAKRLRDAARALTPQAQPSERESEQT